MGWATGAWAEGAWAGTAWAVQSAPVEVPDVTGETQASATSTLEGEGFVVAVETAFSDSIAEGLVISQVPAGGQSANSGSTVVITVSLGVQPVEDEQPTGGWLFLNSFEAELQRRRREEEERRALEEAADEIQNELDRSIAQLLREQEAIDARKAELDRLAALVRAQSDLEAARAYSERVARAFERAAEKGTFSALEALDRELKRAREEEDFLVMALMLLEGA